jgi:DNA-binding IclR family transcriptional regulator
VQEVVDRSGLAFPTASRCLGSLIEAGLVVELTGNRRNRRFAYRDCLAILNEGTELS